MAIYSQNEIEIAGIMDSIFTYKVLTLIPSITNVQPGPNMEMIPFLGLSV